MAFKFVSIIVAFVCSVSAGIIPSGQITYLNTIAIAKTTPIQYVAHSGHSIKNGYIQVFGQPHQDQTPLYHQVPASAVTTDDEEYDSHPQYKYGYNIQDSISGDSKSQSETRDGDQVHGEYSLIDADGFKRTVQYTSDSINGFNAVVTRVPIHGDNDVKAVVSSPRIAKQSPTQLPYVSQSAQEGNYEPVVKGAYAVRPIVRASPVAYPVLKEHHNLSY